MKEITDLRVAQVRMFPADVIPLEALSLQKNMAAVTEAFHFTSVIPSQQLLPSGLALSGMLVSGEVTSSAVQFSGGSFEVDGRTMIVEAIRIEPRRIVIVVFAPSQDADRVYSHLKLVLAQIAPNNRFEQAEPSVTVEETSCVVTLDVPFETFFSDPVRRFVESLPSRLSSPTAKPITRLTKFSVGIHYVMTDEKVVIRGIGFSSKELVIEPRAGADPESLRYFTASPTSSDIHLRLVEELESSLKEHESVHARV